MDDSHIDNALRGFVSRIIERHEVRDDVNGDIREIYGEVKDAGFVVAVVRALVKEARMDAEARHALYQQQEEYRGKLGLFADTPLGEATIRREVDDRPGMDEAHSKWETLVEKPTPFAEQPLGTPLKRGRGRPRKDVWAEAFDGDGQPAA